MSTKSETPLSATHISVEASRYMALLAAERSLAAKEAEVERLREWRQKIIATGWLMHFEHCASSDIAPRSAVKDCDCGLDAALSGD